MGIFEQTLHLYRKTFKRLKPVHVALHKGMTHGVIPVLERVKGLQTVPDDPFWFRLELLLDRHEPETSAQFKRLVKPGMTVLDVGAHVGYYARLCARLVGEKGRVIAFEPHPRTYAVLMKNIAAYPNVTALQLAVAEAEGTAELYDYLMMSASGSLHYDPALLDLQKSHVTADDIAPRIAGDFPVEKFSVRTRPIDDCLAELKITQVDVIKMDIEGAEIGALRGMRTTIANSPGLTLIMEYNPQALKAFDHDPQAALNEVLALGFKRMQIIEADGSLTDLTDKAATLSRMTEQLMTNMGVANLLFSRS